MLQESERAPGPDDSRDPPAFRVLASNEAIFRLLVSSIRDYAVFMLDEHGRVATWNPGAERLKQYRADEIIGKHFSIFYPPEDVAAGKTERELEDAARTGRFEDEGWRVRKDGSRFWANVVINAVRDESGQLVGFAKVTRDLTARKTNEEKRARLLQEQQARALAEAERERFRLLAGASEVLSSSLEYASTLQAVADLAVPRFADWCSVEVLEGDRLKQVAVAHVDPAKVRLARELYQRWPTDPNAPNGVANVLRTGKPELYEEIADELLAKTIRDPEQLRVARELQLRSGMVVPLSARGRTLGAVTLIWAESNRRYRPDDLPLMVELGRRAGLAVDNARLYHEAREAVRLRDEFLSIASHELKTPLTSLQLQVSGIAHSLRRTPLQLERLVGRMELVDRQVTRLTRLVENLLDVSRASAGRLQLDLGPVDLAAVVCTVVEQLKDELAAAHCELRLELPGPGVVGQWDEMRLEQVVGNFVTNAIKYGAGRPIEVTVTKSEERVLLSVRDHGIGIASADQRRIWERFGRAVSEEHYGGLGLGLWIVKEIVEAMGGTVRVESEAGQGARFLVELPLAGPPGPEDTPPAQ